MIVNSLQKKNLNSYIQIVVNTRDEVNPLEKMVRTLKDFSEDMISYTLFFFVQSVAFFGIASLLYHYDLWFLLLLIMVVCSFAFFDFLKENSRNLGVIFTEIFPLEVAIIVSVYTVGVCFIISLEMSKLFSIFIYAIFLSIIVICCYFYINFIIKNINKEIDKLHEIIDKNHNEFKVILTPIIQNAFDELMMADLKSLQDNGLDFVPSDFITEILDNETKKGNLQLLKLPNENGEIHLYKSTNPNPQKSNMVSEELVID